MISSLLKSEVEGKVTEALAKEEVNIIIMVAFSCFLVG